MNFVERANPIHWGQLERFRNEVLALLVSPSSNADNTKCYNDKCWNNDQIKHECRQYYFKIDECGGYKPKAKKLLKSS